MFLWVPKVPSSMMKNQQSFKIYFNFLTKNGGHSYSYSHSFNVLPP